MPENDNRTRRELEAALRGLLGQKPLGQLRVRELTERCGLRRQSFYYHFTDIYDLFAWCLSRERALLLDRLGVEGARCVLFDDSPAACRAAQAAGVAAVGVHDSFYAAYEEEMRTFCDRYIMGFSELL